MKYLLLILFTLLLNGCGAKVIAATDKQVMIENASSYNMDTCLELAEQECQKYDKHARYVPVDLGYQIAGYNCIGE